MGDALNGSLFVISDLHLGGVPAGAGSPGFQMCSAQGRARLAQFIRWIAGRHSATHEVHLLVNGDIVDFLAEQTFSSFTNGDAPARDKLAQAIGHSKEVWEALRAFAGTGARLTLLLGNHDTELSLPAARRLLLETVGPGRVEFLYDNQAYVEGPVLIEHGNRYDGWNAVSHGTLRAIRSQLSRGEAPDEYLGPAGSQLVKNVMNPIKQDYPFVDLLKPEGKAMVPILAVLHPAALQEIGSLSMLAAKSLQVRFDGNGIPRDQQNIGSPALDAGAADPQLLLARRLAGVPDSSNISAMGELKGLIERIAGNLSEKARDWEIGKLLEALKNFASEQREAFDVNSEDETYLRPARAAMDRGYKAVIYGHTHLVKRVRREGDGALYLNTGTWADLMKLPQGILDGDDRAARAQLREFLADLKARRLDGWRRQLPTFARVDFKNGEYAGADVYLYEDGNRFQPVPDGPLTLFDRAG